MIETQTSNPDLLVVSRFKNLRLAELIGDRSQLEVAEAIGIALISLSTLLNLKRTPFCTDGSWTETAIKIAEYFRELPEDLFPRSLYALALPAKMERVYSSEVVMLSLGAKEVRMLAAPAANDFDIERERCAGRLQPLLDRLPRTEREVILSTFGLEGRVQETTSEIAERMSISRTRVGQALRSALARFRHPSVARRLHDYREALAG